MSVGDPITPSAVEIGYPALLGEDFSVVGYPVETVLAEKSGLAGRLPASYDEAITAIVSFADPIITGAVAVGNWNPSAAAWSKSQVCCHHGPMLPPRSSARIVADRMCAAVGALNEQHALTERGFFTASVGFAAVTPAQHLSVDLLIEAADEQLYQATRNRRNQVKGAA